MQSTNTPDAANSATIQDLQAQIDALKTQAPKPAPDAMNITQAAEFLGYSLQTVYNKTSRREIPHFKRNKRLYFSRQKLTAWLLSQDYEVPVNDNRAAILNTVRQQMENAQ